MCFTNVLQLFVFICFAYILHFLLFQIDFKFAPIKDAIVNGGFSAILLLTDPPPKIKPIESITGWVLYF